jgi:hypothetical protein
MSIVSLDLTYFKGMINIPFDNQDADSFQADYIDVYEKEVLIRLLGYDLYKRFAAGLLVEPTIDPIWLALRDGKEYNVDINGNTHVVKWNGLVNTDGISLISDYTYYKWLSQNNEQLTGTGVGKANKENATDYDKNKKLVQAWNRANENAGYNGWNSLAGSLYNFLNNHQTDYEPIVFIELGFINVLGI